MGNMETQAIMFYHDRITKMLDTSLVLFGFYAYKLKLRMSKLNSWGLSVMLCYPSKCYWTIKSGVVPKHFIYEFILWYQALVAILEVGLLVCLKVPTMPSIFEQV